MIKENSKAKTVSNKNFPATIMFILFVLVTTIIPKIISGLSFPQYYFLFFSSALVIIFFFEYYRRYKNILLFSILSILLTSLFPFFHYLVYKNNNHSYFFEKYYLDYNVEQAKNKAANYNDIPYLYNFIKNASDSILSLAPDKLTFENQVNSDSIIIISSSARIENSSNPLLDSEPAISLYTKKFKFINIIKVKGAKTLGDIFSRRFLEFNNISNEIKSPDKNIIMNDFWIESVTGFVFSYIKPLSSMARLIRVLQLITAFLHISILINTLNESNKLTLKRM